MCSNLCSTSYRLSVLTGCIGWCECSTMHRPPSVAPKGPCEWKGSIKLGWPCTELKQGSVLPVRFSLLASGLRWSDTEEPLVLSYSPWIVFFFSPAAFHIKETLLYKGWCQHTGSLALQHVSDKITECCSSHLPSGEGQSMVTLCLVKTWFNVYIILW